MVESALTIEEQLIHLKNATIRFGSLHEAQILQLRNYPLLIPKIDKAEVSINIEKKFVSYKCKSSSKFINTKKNKLLYKKIEEWIRFIVWDDTMVEISVNGRRVYGSGSK